ncbi:MAG: AMP-binding protein [Treponema sp.]|nr:AMP-binding protein [Treponema sp.]
MRGFLRVLFYVIAALYPVLVFTALVILKLPVRVLSLCVIVLALAFFLSATGSKRTNGTTAKADMFSRVRPLVSSILFLAAGLFCFFTNRSIFLKLYSVVISVSLLVVFGSTLIFPPTIVFRFATLSDSSIAGSVAEARIAAYCKKVTIAWCLFFIINGSIAACTALFYSDRVWSVYNGGISYVLMGLMFAVEFIIRKLVNKGMPKVYTISNFKADSRADDYVLCYEGVWSQKNYKTWRDFLSDTAKVRAFVATKPDVSDWILHCEDYWYFLVTFVALLQCKKTVRLTQNITPAFIAEIKIPGTEFLTDQEAEDSISIPQIMQTSNVPPEAQIRNIPAIVADETCILMYTSGSTGKPKVVPQRLTEFEEDNAFVISQWSEEFLKRRLVTTVSQHHIYGFLFGISLPFGLGIPFRRNRIEFPEEFTTLNDTSYLIVTTPAFLKRTVEIEDALPLVDCFIFTSGGALTTDVAMRTKSVFGFCPVEIYGSTETSGIAYRQQTTDGLEWTPFANAKIWKGDDGCLRIVSPYIKDPAGFATADLVDMLENGRFILKGRSDSIVKIEEKRISLTEVENRLLQSGLVADVKVIAMEENRQYLAAAIQLNNAGEQKFSGQKKLALNKFFHDYLMQFFENVVIPKRWRFVQDLPKDVQGKIHKSDIQALFERKQD